MSLPGGETVEVSEQTQLTNDSGVPLKITAIQHNDGSVVGFAPAPECTVGLVVSSGNLCNIEFVTFEVLPPDNGT